MNDETFTGEPFACWAGNAHTWISTGMVRYIFTSTNTKPIIEGETLDIDADTPREYQQKCNICGAIRWFNHG